MDVRDLRGIETMMVVVVVVGAGVVVVGAGGMVKDCYQAPGIPMEDVSGEVCWV